MASQEIEALVAGAGAAPGPRAALGAARGAAPDEAARKRARAAARGASQRGRKLSTCSTCGNVDTRDPCAICRDPRRDDKLLCVVEEVADLWALDRSRLFPGRYHVLGGRLSALEGVRPEDLEHRQAGRAGRGRRHRRGGAGDERHARRPDHRPLSRRAAGEIPDPPDPAGARTAGRRRARLSRRRNARPGACARGARLLEPAGPKD